MPIGILTCVALVGVATVIHYEVLRLLSTVLPRLDMASRARVVIHRVLGGQVVIYLIVDGRRNMQSVLARRLLGA
jgi:hypothetical protein